MTNEQFQNLVLQKLDRLEKGQNELQEEVSGLGEEISGLGEEVSGLGEEVSRLEKKVDRIEIRVDAIYDQTANLTEFKNETEKNIGEILEENRTLKEMVGRHDIEIKTLKRKIG